MLRAKSQPTPLPVFCDLLTHVALNIEGDVSQERARRYKTRSLAAHDEIVTALDDASTMTGEQLRSLMAATLAFAATFWQISHPTPTLAALYQEVPTGVTSPSTSSPDCTRC